MVQLSAEISRVNSPAVLKKRIATATSKDAGHVLASQAATLGREPGAGSWRLACSGHLFLSNRPGWFRPAIAEPPDSVMSGVADRRTKDEGTMRRADRLFDILQTSARRREADDGRHPCGATGGHGAHGVSRHRGLAGEPDPDRGRRRGSATCCAEGSICRR